MLVLVTTAFPLLEHRRHSVFDKDSRMNDQSLLGLSATSPR